MSAISAESPLGQALNQRVHPKLVELGWSSGEVDDTLSEYIILMLANGNNEEQIANELATDLLNTEPDDPAPANFAKWLFQQVSELQHQSQNGAAQTLPSAADATEGGDETGVSGDADMGEGADASGVIPTGPKAMRNGTKGAARDKRMIGSINKSLDRSADSVLHRVRGAQGAGRINSHSRDPPKGPRQTNIQRNLAAAGVGRGAMMQNLPMPGQMGQMPYPQQNGGQMVMDGNQMQQMLHMLERQAQMMAQMSNNMQPGQGGYQNGGRQFGDRVEKRNKFNNRNQQHHNKPATGDTEMGEEGQSKEGVDAAGAQGETGQDKPAEETMCRFNKQCKNPECIYAHSGPATFTGIVVDTTSVCEHGAACMNNRCASRHPSPAKKQQYQATVPCKFGPYCQKPGCTFQHPPNGPCKNGADCTEEGCQFWHNPVLCKYPQCTNKACPYKHAPGQKRGYFRSNTMVFNGDGSQEGQQHVSERQFVAGEGEEELITPGGAIAEGNTEGMDVVS